MTESSERGSRNAELGTGNAEPGLSGAALSGVEGSQAEMGMSEGGSAPGDAPSDAADRGHTTTRRAARESAIQLLFELDANPQQDLTAMFKRCWAARRLDEKGRAFTEHVVKGVRQNLKSIDQTIQKYAENWDIKRMAILDRNVIRMGIFEMLFCDDVPPVVSINEAVDIAKYFSSAESGRFVNGILDRLRKDLKRPARTARTASS